MQAVEQRWVAVDRAANGTVVTCPHRPGHARSWPREGIAELAGWQQDCKPGCAAMMRYAGLLATALLLGIRLAQAAPVDAVRPSRGRCTPARPLPQTTACPSTTSPAAPFPLSAELIAGKSRVILDARCISTALQFVRHRAGGSAGMRLKTSGLVGGADDYQLVCRYPSTLAENSAEDAAAAKAARFDAGAVRDTGRGSRLALT